MKWKNFFKMPSKDEKISEVFLLTRITTSIAIILTLMAGMTFSAYAFYMYSVASAPNTISAAAYELDMAVTVDGAAVTLKDGSFTAEGGKTYEITLKYKEGSASTGFCVVTIGDTVYHTEQISNAQLTSGGQGGAVVFYVKTTGTGSQTVKLQPHWGTSSRYAEYEDQGANDSLYIKNGESVQLTFQAQPPADPEKPINTDPVATEPAATEPVATEPAPPASTEPATTEPAAPEATEPATTEPISTEPAATEPATAE